MADGVAVAAAVVAKVADSLFDVIKKEIGYMWNCKQNVKNLTEALRDLKDMRDRVQQQTVIAKDKGDNLVAGVEEWVEEAAQEITKAQAFLEQEGNAKKTCLKIGMCGNWATLHRYGKKTVTEKTPALLMIQQRGKAYESCASLYVRAPTQVDVYENKDLGGVSVETRAPGPLDAYQKKNLEDLVTHNLTLKAIIAAIEDESKQIIGIYGLGGVGKTTLAKEVVAKVKHLFADVAFTTISQTVNADKIQKDLKKATKRIMKGDKILIIIDDVWEKLDLEELCIPCGSEHKNCKILLTSRKEDVCDKMNAQCKIYVNSLPTKEAWILFKRFVGEKVETDDSLKPVAMKVVEECGGLPLLIQAVGNALKSRSIGSWKSAHNQLKKHAPAEIDSDIMKAFNHLKLSYDYLESEKAKSCFLLCSMFPEDHDILLEDLVYYLVGLEKFDELDSIEDARCRVQNAVNILTSSGLLLKVEKKEPTTKMHDVVRGVALLIASKDENKYLVKAGQGLTEWQPRDTSLESYAGISVAYNDIVKLPDYKVNVPHLKIFLVNANDALPMISDEFIGCMKEVKVLDISWNDISSLPQSFQALKKLRTLDLRGNKSLHEISILGELKDLEILIMNETGITEIPKEIGGLINLRVLQVNGCEDLSSIAPGVISALLRLEELRIEFKLKFKGASDCIVEVMSLSKLTYLGLAVPSIDDIPAHCFNSEKLKEFVIHIGQNDRYSKLEPYNPIDFISWSGRYLVLSRKHLVIPLVKGLKELIEGSRPITLLIGIENLNKIMPTLYHGFNKLEHIELSRCPNVSCLVDDTTSSDWNEGKTEEKYFMQLKHLKLSILNNLEVLWKCSDEYISLTNLVSLDIYECEKLVKLFTVGVARGLVSLKELRISWCDGLEEVIYGGGDGEEMERGESEEIVEQQQQHDSSSAANNNIIVFPSLAKISLNHLLSLKSFFNSAGGGNGNGNCSSSIIIKYPSLVHVEIEYCSSLWKWGPGIHETPNLKFLNGNVPILLDAPSPINLAVEKCMERFALKVVDCDCDSDDGDDDVDE